MKDINKAIIMGRLGQDSELRYGASGTPFLNFDVATNRQIFNGEGENAERRTETTWHHCVLIGPQAERAAQLLAKGARVYVEGRTQTRRWEGENGQRRERNEIIIEDWSLESSPATSAAQPEGRSSPEVEAPTIEEEPAEVAPAPAARAKRRG